MGNKKYQPSRHHIIPRSRGGYSNLENIAHINQRDHNYYHALFSNKVPEEIINYLVKDYWNGQWEHVTNAYDKYRI